jgi:hypothetical protein
MRDFATDARVDFYDPAISNFTFSLKAPKGWGAISNRVVLPGESFFLKAPADTGHEITLEGEAPAGPVEIQVHESWSALGHPYPWAIAWTDTALASQLPAGTLVYFWDLSAQAFITFQKGPAARGGWGAASNHIIQPGDGFLVRLAARFHSGCSIGANWLSIMIATPLQR